MTPEPAIALRKATAARSNGAAQRVRDALIELEREGATVTFAVVAARARVSRQFLYSHADLRADIERLRGVPVAPARIRSLRVGLKITLGLPRRLLPLTFAA